MKKYFVILFSLIVISLSAQIGLDERYHTYEEIVQILDSLQINYPDIVKVEYIGTTLGADPYQDPIPIIAIKLSNNAAVDEDEPAIMFAGQCHAEEVLGVEVTMYMIEEIVANRMVAPYSVWLDNLEMWFVPTYNPEGLQVVMDGWDVTYRKNKRDNNENGIFDFVVGSGGDIDGVDTNRNYSFNWIHGDTLYVVGPEQWNDYYRGPGPFSEGGTQAIRDLAEQQHFIYSVNWHSSRTGNFSEKVFYSFNWSGAKPSPDFTMSQNIGETVAGLIVKENGATTYEPYASSGRKGNAHDWFYKEHGTFQLLIECGTEIIQPPPAVVDDTCERCSIGAYWLLDRSLGYNASAAMLTGHITDSQTGETLVAEVRLDEMHSAFFTPRLSDELYGRYWRPTMPGTYTVRVIKKGYEEKVVDGVTVNNSLWKVENIALDPLEEIDVNGSVTAGGNPVDATLIIENGVNLPVDIVQATAGVIDFSNYEGEHNIIVYAEDFVPYSETIELISGVIPELEIELDSAVIVFEENWEDGLSSWNITGDWAITSNANFGDNAITDSPDVFYENGTNAYIATSPINLHGVDADAVLTFWHKFQTEHEYDFCFVEYSLDGANWNVLREFSGREKVWHQEFIFIPELIDEYVNLRFRVETDGSIDDPGWWLDDIQILSSQGASVNNEIPEVNPQLLGNYPNPFNPTTTISYQINSEQNENAKIEIYNLRGQRVKQLHGYSAFQQSIDRYSLVWNGTDDNQRPVSSGIYFYKLTAGKYTSTKKMILMK